MNHTVKPAAAPQHTPGAKQSAPTREQRIAGALLGVHTGDALGATCEFRSWAEIRAKYPDGLRHGGPFAWPPRARHRRHGLPVSPTAWVEALQSGEEFLCAAHRLATISPPGRARGC